jgi:hypothetical protein
LIVLILLVGAGAMVVGASDERARQQQRSSYAPAESLAGPMTPEWKAFAEEVDHACARNFNAMQLDLQTTWARADTEGWDDATTSAAAWHIQALHQTDTYDEVTALGTPPARPELFQQWAANVGRRAQLMDEVSQAWARGDADRAAMTASRIDALKVDANWLGQNFGLRICTSNGPGHETGDAVEPYLQQINDACLDRNAREDQAGAARKLTPLMILRLSKTETVNMAIIGPPPEQYAIRARILQIKRSLDSYAEAQLRRAYRSRDFERTWNRLSQPLTRRSYRAALQLQAIGLPDCSNWGPAPAPSLLPHPPQP